MIREGVSTETLFLRHTKRAVNRVLGRYTLSIGTGYYGVASVSSTRLMMDGQTLPWAALTPPVSKKKKKKRLMPLSFFFLIMTKFELIHLLLQPVRTLNMWGHLT